MQSQADIRDQLMHWYKSRHSFDGTNQASAHSEELLLGLEQQILMPIVDALGDLTITYGFTGPALSRFIKRHAPNSRGKLICDRAGSACDFWVAGYEQNMHQVALFICQRLQFDKLYFYGRNRPVHVSFADEPLRHLQLMQQDQRGRRIPGKKAFGDASAILATEL
jgi:hypothetical protein